MRNQKKMTKAQAPKSKKKITKITPYLNRLKDTGTIK